jgi:hypothetical protein
MPLDSPQFMTEMSIRNLARVKFGERLRLTASRTSVSRLSRKCGGFDVPQSYGPSRPVARAVLPLYLFTQHYFKINITICNQQHLDNYSYNSSLQIGTKDLNGVKFKTYTFEFAICSTPRRPTR